VGLTHSPLVIGQQCSFNFGKTPFTYPHPNSDFKVLHCFLSEAEVESLNQLFNKYKGKDVATIIAFLSLSRATCARLRC
jgi:hypothetical protein